jgi:hypothetical protein
MFRIKRGSIAMTSSTELSAGPASHIRDMSDFDYASVPSSVAKFLKSQATRIRQYTGKTIIQIGKDLIAAKRYLSHGQFLIWVEREVGIPARTAQAYMQAAQWASDKHATVALLPPSLLYVLSSPSTPKEFAEDILKRAEAGERMMLTTIRAELRTLQSKKREEAALPAAASLKRQDNCVDKLFTRESVENPLDEIVHILARTLSTSELARVCEILTSDNLLDRPDLPKKIKVAFLGLSHWDAGRDDNEQPRNVTKVLMRVD